MTPYDVTADDEPLDVRAVGQDDLLVEQLRHALSPDGAVIWDDDDDELDPAFALLRALQLDVSADLPMAETILPAGVTELLPRRRHMSRSAAIAVVAASVLSIGGVAAASAPGQPLAGVRHAVSEAVSSAVKAITPDRPVGPGAATKRHSAKPTPSAVAASAAARSAAAVQQIEANLARAANLIDKGRYEPARNQLSAAASQLQYVTDAAVKAGLQSQLTALQARLPATPTAKPTAKATHAPSDDKGKSGNDNRSNSGKDGEHNRDHNGTNSGSNSGSNRGSDSGKSGPAVEPTPEPNATRSPHSGNSDRTDQHTAEPTPQPQSDGGGSNSGGRSH